MHLFQQSKLFIVILFTCFFLCACTSTMSIAEQPQTQQFITKMSKHYDFDKHYLAAVFNEVKPQSQIIKTMSKPHEKLPWYLYRKTFLTQRRIQEGVKYWQDHAESLQQVEHQYGVPASIIVAILGVETHYGANMGKYRVMDALSTLAFYYPPRAAFFEDELTQFLLLTREESRDPLSIYGSYAGAMGEPQFMPSSYRHYAIAKSQLAQPDLFHNQDDIIISVANYFKKHGWQTGQPIACPAQIHGNNYATLISSTALPTLSLAEYAKYGINPSHAHSSQQAAALLRFDGTHEPEYWFSFHNFYVITRYNTSPLYALAVYQLSEKIQTSYVKQLATTKNRKGTSQTNMLAHADKYNM